MDAGYTYEEIDDPHVSIKIADICWREDKIIKMTTAAVRAAKMSFATDWNDVISDKEFSGIEMSKVERKTPVAEKYVPTDPKNIIVPDPALYVDTPQDLEFLALIGVAPEGDK
jgi:uroporphyrinogen-III decarboxylase